MATTHIRMSCPNCNYSYSTSIYGYAEDPIGAPFTRCPRCNQIFKDDKHKEWIQMSPLKKYFSISPRGGAVSIMLAVLTMVGFITSMNDLETAIFCGVMSVLCVILNYIIVLIRLNSSDCMERIISSIARTNNEDYAEVIANLGPIYDYSIPRILLLTEENGELLESAIKSKKEESILIPTFMESIDNH